MLTVAIIALVFSVASLGWNIFNAWSRLPRVQSILGKEVRVFLNRDPSEGPDIEYGFVVSAINSGSEATTVIDAGLTFFNGDIAVSVSAMRGIGVEIEGPPLPARLEAHGALSWTIPDERTRNLGDETLFQGYSARFQPRKPWWSRNLPYTATVHEKTTTALCRQTESIPDPPARPKLSSDGWNARAGESPRRPTDA